MDLQKVKELVEYYKKHFHAISNEEIYKWRAVKCFQDNWNIHAEDFFEMLAMSFNRSKNLLSSGNYFPLRMLLLCTREEPETVRKLFIELYDEESDMVERIENFQAGLALLNGKYFARKKDYQDDRAVVAYLTFRFPDRYFFYKYGMFKEFVDKVDYPYKPKLGLIENVLVYLELCSLLRTEIVKDEELLELHAQRLTKNEFFDSSYHILTQDVIYAAVRHVDKFEKQVKQKQVLKRLQMVNKRIASKPDKAVLKGTFTNYIENEKSKKRIGDLGELLVLKYEHERLKQSGSRFAPIHVAKTKGDGEGYDILSFNELGEEIFIEVKTTISRYDAPFYITRNELEKSLQDKERFYLYRLYDFDEKEDTAKFYIQQGSLESLCINPILYRVTVEEKGSSGGEDFTAEKL